MENDKPKYLKLAERVDEFVSDCSEYGGCGCCSSWDEDAVRLLVLEMINDILKIE